jgi:photosystem II stability/assembly factor-like uncharacterized protein
MKILTISIFLFFSSAIFAQNFNWTAQNSGVTVKLNDVYFTNNQTGWAVGDNGTIVNTTDDGQTWNSQTSGTSENLLSVFFIDATKGCAVGGTTNKTMLKTTDGGTTWEDASVNSIPNKNMLDIEFSDINNGWVLTRDSVYMTTDGGSTWNTEAFQNTIETQICNALSVTSDTTAFIAASRKVSVTSREASVFYRNTVDMPLVWSISPFNQSTTDDEFKSIDFTNAKIGFAGGEKGKIYKKSGTGDQDAWNLNIDISSTGALSITSISFPNDNNGMFTTTVSGSSSINSLIYHTTDMGDNWSVAPDTIIDLTSPVLYAPDTDNAWIVGFGGKIYKGVRTSVGFNKLKFDLDVKVYPNPATDIINVRVKTLTNDVINYTLSDISGRIIKTGENYKSTFSVNISDYNMGVYLLKLSTDKGQSTFRILKK